MLGSRCIPVVASLVNGGLDLLCHHPVALPVPLSLLLAGVVLVGLPPWAVADEVTDLAAGPAPAVVGRGAVAQGVRVPKVVLKQ